MASLYTLEMGIRPKIANLNLLIHFRFALGISVVFVLVFQSIAIAWIWNSTAAIIYLGFSIALAGIVSEVRFTSYRQRK